MDPHDSTHYQLLFQAMKKNEVSLGELKSFQALMEMLYLYFGAVSKANQYFQSHQGVHEVSPLFWRGFEWRYGVAFGRTGAPIVSGRWVKTRKKGPLLVLKVLVKKGERFRFNLLFHRPCLAIDAQIERFLARPKGLSFIYRSLVDIVHPKGDLFCQK